MNISPLLYPVAFGSSQNPKAPKGDEFESDYLHPSKSDHFSLKHDSGITTYSAFDDQGKVHTVRRHDPTGEVAANIGDDILETILGDGPKE